MNPTAVKYGAAQFPEVNLLPSDIADKAKMRAVVTLCAVLVAGAVALSVVLSLGARVATGVARSELDGALGKQEAAAKERDDLAYVYTDYREYEQQLFAISQAAWGEVYYGVLQSQFMTAIDPTTTFLSMNVATYDPVTGGYPVSEGDALAPYGVGRVEFTVRATDYASSVAFIERLEATPGFEWVRPTVELWADSPGDPVFLVSGSATISRDFLSGRYIDLFGGEEGLIKIDPVQSAQDAGQIGTPQATPDPAQPTASASPSEGAEN